MIRDGKKKACIVLPIFLLFLGLFFFLYSYSLVPMQIRLLQGEQDLSSIKLPFMVTVKSEQPGLLDFNGQSLAAEQLIVAANQPWTMKCGQSGTADLQVKLLGCIPFKTVKVRVVTPTKVVPLGNSIGILMQSEGAVVVGFSSVVDASGRVFYPGRDAGIALGDMIVEINQQKITTIAEMITTIGRLGEQGAALQVKIKRGKNSYVKTIKPVLCHETGRYQLGLFVLDDTEGVGTLTFYNPSSGYYGALGHLVLEGNTNTKMELKKGKIVEVSIAAVEKAKRGKAGEKIGTFFAGKDRLLGNIEKNTILGIYGKMTNLPVDIPSTMTVALVDQVEEGPAEILTVIENKKVERFAIEIEKVIPQKRSNDKGLVIRVTDPRLLQKTGGIVQGMSGSPIIQKGKLVGAVTHVFVNDPTRGYGVLAEWMVKQTLSKENADIFH